jgi:hypothetical protein
MEVLEGWWLYLPEEGPREKSNDAKTVSYHALPYSDLHSISSLFHGTTLSFTAQTFLRSDV